MVNIFRKLFIKNYNETSNPKVREAHGKLATIVGIISNLLLFVAKFLIGFFAGSISIMGDSYNATVGKYFFNKSGDDYVAIIPFAIADDAVNGWSGSSYAAWGKIGVGDNVSVKAAEKQFNFDNGTINFAATNNIGFDTIVPGKKGIITVTASASGCTAVATVY